MKVNRYADVLKGNLKLGGLELYEAIVQNRELADKCELHNFNMPIKEGKTISQKWQCSNCGTVVDYSEKRMYELGLKHSKPNK